MAELSKVRYAPTGKGIYPVLAVLMATTLVLSNIGAAKGVVIGPFVTDGGFFLFPLAYIVGDVVSEIYGFRASRTAIIATFAMSVFAAVSYFVIIMLPAASWYDGQEALERTLGQVPLVVIASLLGFLSGQLLNAWILVRLKTRTGEKKLFGRLALSTLVGEFIDTLVFCTIAAQVIGVDSFATFLNYLLVGFAFKTVVEIMISPVTLFVIRVIKRFETDY